MADETTGRRVNISDVREIFVVPMLTVSNVMKLLVCSRASAYEHMNRALGRTERRGNLLRVPLDVFEAYVKNELGLGAPRAPEQARSGLLGTARLSGSPGTLASSSSSGAPVIRVAKAPRPRR